jgi:hypothetical protein
MNPKERFTSCIKLSFGFFMFLLKKSTYPDFHTCRFPSGIEKYPKSTG